MMLTIQVLASAALVVAVLFFMWKLPQRGETLFGWAPPLALLSAWTGLAALIGSGLLWCLPGADRWIVLDFLLLDPASIATGTLVLWIYRGRDDTPQTIAMQRLQARVGIVLGLAAVAMGYIFVMTHKHPFTAVGS